MVKGVSKSRVMDKYREWIYKTGHTVKYDELKKKDEIIEVCKNNELNVVLKHQLYLIGKGERYLGTIMVNNIPDNIEEAIMEIMMESAFQEPNG